MKSQRQLATTIDESAEKNPSQRFAVIPHENEVKNEYQELSMKDLAQAVNFMCWWIEDTIGQAQSRETLAYMGANDVRYFVFMIACQKTGYQVRETGVISELGDRAVC